MRFDAFFAALFVAPILGVTSFLYLRSLVRAWDYIINRSKER
jgi:hypothetical protein